MGTAADPGIRAALRRTAPPRGGAGQAAAAGQTAVGEAAYAKIQSRRLWGMYMRKLVVVLLTGLLLTSRVVLVGAVRIWRWIQPMGAGSDTGAAAGRASRVLTVATLTAIVKSGGSRV